MHSRALSRVMHCGSSEGGHSHWAYSLQSSLAPDTDGLLAPQPNPARQSPAASLAAVAPTAPMAPAATDPSRGSPDPPRDPLGPQGSRKGQGGGHTHARPAQPTPSPPSPTAPATPPPPPAAPRGRPRARSQCALPAPAGQRRGHGRGGWVRQRGGQRASPSGRVWEPGSVTRQVAVQGRCDYGVSFRLAELRRTMQCPAACGAAQRNTSLLLLVTPPPLRSCLHPSTPLLILTPPAAHPVAHVEGHQRPHHARRRVGWAVGDGQLATHGVRQRATQPAQPVHRPELQVGDGVTFMGRGGGVEVEVEGVLEVEVKVGG